MSNQQINSLLARPIAFHPAFVAITGSVTAALMLSQAWYWKDRTNNADGWFYKTQKDWQEETGLTRYEQETARRVLKEKSFLEEKTAPPYRLYFRVNKDAVFQALGVETPQVGTPHAEKPQLQEFQKNEDAEIPHAEIQQVETPQSSCSKPTCQHVVFPQPITENTIETKTKSTKREQAQGLPLAGLILTEPNKAEQSDGRKKNGRKENKSGAPADDPALAAFRDRLKEHREATVGAPSVARYFTQEAAGIKTLWAKLKAGQVTEADCIELFNIKLNQWRGRGATGYSPNWFYVNEDIMPWIKNRNLRPTASAHGGYVSQADINAPRPGRVVL